VAQEADRALDQRLHRAKGEIKRNRRTLQRSVIRWSQEEAALPVPFLNGAIVNRVDDSSPGSLLAFPHGMLRGGITIVCPDPIIAQVFSTANGGRSVSSRSGCALGGAGAETTGRETRQRARKLEAGIHKLSGPRHKVVSTKTYTPPNIQGGGDEGVNVERESTSSAQTYTRVEQHTQDLKHAHTLTRLHIPRNAVLGRAVAEGFSLTSPRAHWIGPEA